MSAKWMRIKQLKKRSSPELEKETCETDWMCLCDQRFASLRITELI